LSKPYDRDRLAMKVRRVLDGPTKSEDSEQTATVGKVSSNIPSPSADQ